MNENVLIAEFMGASIINDPKWRPDDAGVYLKYHKSWDWLIPVAQKIKNLTYKDLKSQELPTFQQASARWHAVQNEIGNLKIEAAHYCVIHWIKWYNEQPKP